MAQKSFNCKLVTPTASLVNDKLTYASVPLWDGLAGFLPGRAPMLAKMGAGELRLEFADSKVGEGGSRSFLVEGGFVKMAGEELTILAERATAVEELVLSDAEAELRKAENAPATTTTQVEQRTKDREIARLKVSLARKRSGI